jgi:hypothetical protein
MSGITMPSAREARRRWPAFRSYRVRWPEWVAALSALALLIALLGFSWFTFLRASGGRGPKYYVSYSEDGWNGLAHAHWLILVTILLALALLAFQATRPAPAVPVTLSLFLMFVAGLSALWLVVRVPFDPPGGRDLGGWLALVSAAVLTWAAYRSVRMEGIAPEDAPREIPTVEAPAIAAGAENSEGERDPKLGGHS